MKFGVCCGVCGSFIVTGLQRVVIVQPFHSNMDSSPVVLVKQMHVCVNSGRTTHVFLGDTVVVPV